VSELGQVETGSRRPQKSDAAFRTISEVSEDLDVPQHVLRFWESRFPTIKPLKRGGGRRYYRPEDIQLLRRIRDLLYKDGYTIRGVQKLLREPSRADAVSNDLDPNSAAVANHEPTATIPPPSVQLAETARPIPVPSPTPSAGRPPVLDRPLNQPAMASGITGARRAQLETVLTEVDELRETLAKALGKNGR